MSVSSNPLLSGTSNFSQSSVFFRSYEKFVNLEKSMKFVSSRKPMGSTSAAWGLVAYLSSGSEKTVLYIGFFFHIHYY